MTIPADLYITLNARARADQHWPEIGFHDQAAAMLAQLLGVSVHRRQDPLWERRCVQRSQWFDQRCRDFFHRFPEGMCIDLGAGLSTRFHRLSQADDWPRFRWVDVDLPEVTALKSGVMPDIDNYALLSAHILRDNWLAASGWNADMPLIITLESIQNEFTLHQIQQLFESIAHRCAGAAVVEIAMDYSDHFKQSWHHRLFNYLLSSEPQLLIRQLHKLGFNLSRMDTLPGKGALGLLVRYDNSLLHSARTL